eukprot:c6701_g1_i2.p1 GENE.c6701_g1_i2~~c6701_g1_i2.p1  ORF type:complete len:733 (+),score=219.08 c6701_g1_i2:259-2199(+)
MDAMQQRLFDRLLGKLRKDLEVVVSGAVRCLPLPSDRFKAVMEQMDAILQQIELTFPRVDCSAPKSKLRSEINENQKILRVKNQYALETIAKAAHEKAFHGFQESLSKHRGSSQQQQHSESSIQAAVEECRQTATKLYRSETQQWNDSDNVKSHHVALQADMKREETDIISEVKSRLAAESEKVKLVADSASERFWKILDLDQVLSNSNLTPTVFDSAYKRAIDSCVKEFNTNTAQNNREIVEDRQKWLLRKLEGNHYQYAKDKFDSEVKRRVNAAVMSAEEVFIQSVVCLSDVKTVEGSGTKECETAKLAALSRFSQLTNGYSQLPCVADAKKELSLKLESRQSNTIREREGRIEQMKSRVKSLSDDSFRQFQSAFNVNAVTSRENFSETTVTTLFQETVEKVKTDFRGKATEVAPQQVVSSYESDLISRMDQSKSDVVAQVKAEVRRAQEARAIESQRERDRMPNFFPNSPFQMGQEEPSWMDIFGQGRAPPPCPSIRSQPVTQPSYPSRTSESVSGERQISNRWNQFQHDNKGRGYSKEQMLDAYYKRYGNTDTPEITSAALYQSYTPPRATHTFTPQQTSYSSSTSVPQRSYASSTSYSAPQRSYASSTSSTPSNSWNAFQQQMGGQGYSKAEIHSMYKSRK